VVERTVFLHEDNHVLNVGESGWLRAGRHDRGQHEQSESQTNATLQFHKNIHARICQALEAALSSTVAELSDKSNVVKEDGTWSYLGRIASFTDSGNQLIAASSLA
jgi:hypothetical protein